MRNKIIIGNWKMVLTNTEAINFANSIKDIIEPNNVDVVLCPSYPAIESLARIFEGTQVLVGAQNVHYEKNGSFTGEVNVDMLKDLGVKYVIVGHSERRNKLNETDKEINKKIKLLLEENMIPILCVGENIEERDNGSYFEKVEFQIRKALEDVDIRIVENVIIAYEPVWAISTSSQEKKYEVTKDSIEEMSDNIRYVLEKIYGTDISQRIRILYGGSVSSENAKEFLKARDIDGLLIGAKSMSLDILKIIKIANEK